MCEKVLQGHNRHENGHGVGAIHVLTTPHLVGAWGARDVGGAHRCEGRIVQRAPRRRPRCQRRVRTHWVIIVRCLLITSGMAGAILAHRGIATHRNGSSVPAPSMQIREPRAGGGVRYSSWATVPAPEVPRTSVLVEGEASRRERGMAVCVVVIESNRIMSNSTAIPRRGLIAAVGPWVWPAAFLLVR